MSDFKAFISTAVIGVIVYFIYQLGIESSIYFFILPPLFFALFAILGSRMPRTREAYTEDFEKKQSGHRLNFSSEQANSGK